MNQKKLAFETKNCSFWTKKTSFWTKKSNLRYWFIDKIAHRKVFDTLLERSGDFFVEILHLKAKGINLSEKLEKTRIKNFLPHYPILKNTTFIAIKVPFEKVQIFFQKLAWNLAFEPKIIFNILIYKQNRAPESVWYSLRKIWGFFVEILNLKAKGINLSEEHGKLEWLFTSLPDTEKRHFYCNQSSIWKSTSIFSEACMRCSFWTKKINNILFFLFYRWKQNKISSTLCFCKTTKLK